MRIFNMKYEHLNKIDVSRKEWPVGKTVKLKAYAAEDADAAIEEIVNWYKQTKEELDTLKETSSATIKELNEKIVSLTNETKKYEAEVQSNVEAMGDYKIQIKNLTDTLTEKNDLIKQQNDTILRMNVGVSHNLEDIDKLKNKINELEKTIEQKNKDLEIHKHNLEEERLAVKVLKEKNDKIEERLNSLTNTLDKISEYAEFYKNFAKSN